MERGVRFPHHVGFVVKTNTGHGSLKERKKERKKEEEEEELRRRRRAEKKKKTGPKSIVLIMNEYSRR